MMIEIKDGIGKIVYPKKCNMSIEGTISVLHGGYGKLSLADLTRLATEELCDGWRIFIPDHGTYTLLKKSNLKIDNASIIKAIPRGRWLKLPLQKKSIENLNNKKIFKNTIKKENKI